jgi:DNA-binding CsgD family transcriptional regulator
MDSKDNLRRVEMLLGEAGRLGRMGFWEYDLNSSRSWWSDAMYALLGRNPSKGPPSFEEHARLHGENEALFRNIARETLESGKRTAAEFTQKLPDGSRGWYSLLVNVDRDPDGKDCRLFGIVQDTTEHKLMKARLRESRAKVKRCCNRLKDKNLALKELIKHCQEGQDGTAVEVSAPSGFQLFHEKLSILTPRELQVCLEIHTGRSSKEIAGKMGIELSSVETHRRNIRRKLRIKGKNLLVHLRALIGH